MQEMGVLSCKVLYSPKITTRNKHIEYSPFCFAMYLRSYIVELKKTSLLLQTVPLSLSEQILVIWQISQAVLHPAGKIPPV